jgi:site-specific recombinase XerD
MTIQLAFQGYVLWLRKRGLRKKTIENYSYYLQSFLNQYRFFKVEEISLEIIEEQIVHFLNRNLGERTYREMCIVLRAFIKWMVREELIKIKIHNITIPKASESTIQHLTKDELDAFFNHLYSTIVNISTLRDFVFFYVLYSTGCRISEVLALNRSSIDWGTRQAQIIGKGGKRRIIFFSPTCLMVIEKYLKRRKDDCNALFVNYSNNADKKNPRLSRYTVQKSLKRNLKTLGIRKKVTPHIFRHTYATLMLDQGADLRSIQLMLGHQSLETTQKYLHVSNPLLKGSYDLHLYSPKILKLRF